MKLSKLIKDIPHVTHYGPKHIEVTGISGHSSLVSPGNLFIAKRGLSTDGSRYIQEALRAGAVAILSDMYDPSLKDIAQIIHSDVSSIEGELVSTYYGYPDQDLLMIGVTGTKGKTTTTFLVQHLQGQAGLIGTIEYDVGAHRYPATHTTPDVLTNHRLLREMRDNGLKAAVMEVSSHALMQHRVDAIEFDIAIYTNLFPDHLDYHKTMEEYKAAKNRLFTSLLASKYTVFNADCPYAQEVIRGTKARLLSYGIKNFADVKASDIQLSLTGSTFLLNYQGEKELFFSSLVGEHNVYNALAAISALLAAGYTLTDLKERLQTFQAVPGRLERVANTKSLSVFVDFAHTGNALEKVLEALIPYKKGRLITLFGCGGNRDPARRVGMAKVAEQFSDVVIVTNDNPRSEEPDQIIQEILAGFQSKDKVHVEPDREQAIFKAIGMAKPEDIVLLAGKGHEKVQIFKNHTIEFDDCLVARSACEKS